MVTNDGEWPDWDGSYEMPLDGKMSLPERLLVLLFSFRDSLPPQGWKQWKQSSSDLGECLPSKQVLSPSWCLQWISFQRLWNLCAIVSAEMQI